MTFQAITACPISSFKGLVGGVSSTIPPITKRVKDLAVSIFKAIISSLKIFETPLSFIGSKYPSLPEVAIRTALAAKKVLLGQKITSMRSELLETGWNYQSRDVGLLQRPKSLSDDDKALNLQLMNKSLLYTRLYAYNHATGQKGERDASLEACKARVKADWMPPGYEEAYDFNEDGLRITFIKGDGKLHVIFGAKNAAGSKHVLKNIGETVTTMAGFQPDIYKRALEEYNRLMSEQFSSFQQNDVVLSGLCLGGALASYVTLKSDSGESAVVLNPLGLSPRMQWDIGRDNLRKANEKIEIFSVLGDFASAPIKPIPQVDVLLNFIGIRTVGNFGKRYHMQAPPNLRLRLSQPLNAVANLDPLHVFIYRSIYYQFTGEEVEGRSNAPIKVWLKQKDSSNSNASTTTT